MATVRVDELGLHVWAAQCQNENGNLASKIAPSASGPTGQRTATAAQAADTGVDTTIGALAARAQATGGKANMAAGHYVGTDENSAQRIDAVADPPVV